MRIRQQLRLTILLFAAALVIGLASAGIIGRSLSLARERESAANEIAQSASDMAFLSTDYLMNPELRQRNGWVGRYQTFSLLLANLRASTPQQEIIVQEIQSNASRLKQVFDDVSSSALGQIPERFGGAFSGLSSPCLEPSGGSEQKPRFRCSAALTAFARGG